MRFVVNVPPFAEPEAIVELGVEAERAGWDAFLLWEHIVVDPGGNVGFVTPDDIVGIIDEFGTRRGSVDGFDVVVNAGPPPTASMDDFAEAGATWWMVSMGEFPGWFDELRELVLAGPPR